MTQDSPPLEAAEGWLVAAGTPGNQRFGRLMKQLRVRSGLTPEELATGAEVHVSFVRGIERGVQAPSLVKAKALLACMSEQERIEWVVDAPPDLRILDEEQGSTSFQFKAEMQGQNRRKQPVDLTGIKAGLLLFAERSGQLLEGMQAAQAGEAASVSPNERIGMIVRLLPDADATTLIVIEKLLRAQQSAQASD